MAKLEVVITRATGRTGEWDWRVLEDGVPVAHSNNPRGFGEASEQAHEWIAARETFQEFQIHVGADGRMARGPKPEPK